MTGLLLYFLVEEPSMEAFLEEVLPRTLTNRQYRIIVFRGKQDLKKNLVSRLRGYKRFLQQDCRIFVLVDRDDDDCRELKAELETCAAEGGLVTRSQGGGAWQVVNRIVVEELEAWYFGDWQAVRQAWPRVSPNIPGQARYRDPDAIKGGTWEAFERILQRAGYFKAGLAKIEAARAVGAYIDPSRNRSRSFTAFRDALAEAVS